MMSRTSCCALSRRAFARNSRMLRLALSSMKIFASASFEAAGDTSDTTFALIELLDRLDCFHHLIFHGKHLAFEAVVAHGENALFYFVEKIIYLVLFLVGTPDALGRSGNDLAQDVFVANDLQVVLKIRRRRNERK